MSTATALPPQPPSLVGRKLPRWALAAVAAGALAVAGLLAVLGPAHSPEGFVLWAAGVFLIGQSVASFVVEGGRHARDRLATALIYTAFVITVIPLVSVLYLTLKNGLERFDSTFFTSSLRNISATNPGGGVYHALIGTIEQVLIASLFAAPIGILVAIYLVEYGRGRFARTVSTFVDVMTGLPSIVAGLFILSFWILALGQDYSGFAGSLALTILMLPIVVRSTEEMLRLVPDALREASFALGVPRWKTIVRIVIPTALPGIVTGVMLGVARIAGETAPVLLVTFGTNSLNENPFNGPQASLPLFVYQQASLPNQVAINRAWTGALTLILLVMLLNLAARLVTYFTRARMGR